MYLSNSWSAACSVAAGESAIDAIEPRRLWAGVRPGVRFGTSVCPEGGQGGLPSGLSTSDAASLSREVVLLGVEVAYLSAFSPWGGSTFDGTYLAADG